MPHLQKGQLYDQLAGQNSFLNVKESFIAHKINVDKEGEYAIKVR